MINISDALRKAVAQTLGEMIIAGNRSPSEIAGFPTLKVSFTKPEKGVFKVLKGKDLLVALKKDQKIFIYQEA